MNLLTITVKLWRRSIPDTRVKTVPRPMSAAVPALALIRDSGKSKLLQY